MAQTCVHQGCGKPFTDADADAVCKYHPGPPVFHEGQKGWSCCKPRVLTFEEFMGIPPCTEGKHSTTDLPPKIEKKATAADAEATLAAAAAKKKTDDAENDSSLGPAMPRTPISMPTREKTQPAAAPVTATPAPAAKAEEEDEEDDPTLEIPDGRTCKRRGCNATYTKGMDRSASAPDEGCEHHPGVPIFHEGSKGYSCCKRRVLEFDQFMKIEGCQKKPRHLFVGRKKVAAGGAEGGDAAEEEEVKDVRFDFYQSATSLTVSFFLKKIDKERAVVTFAERSVTLDLPTTDGKRHRKVVSLYGPIDADKSRYSVLGTKLEVVLAKAAVSSWPVLRSDDRPTGEIFQVARAGKIER